jgi:hypothetical protein
MVKKEKVMENKKTLSKKAKIVIAVIAALLIITALVLTIVFVSMDKNHTALNKEEPNISDNPSGEGNEDEIPKPPVSDETGMAGGEKTEFDKVEKLEGNTILSPEREVLLEPNIIKTIEFANSKIPILNEKGCYYTDEKGNLQCYEIEVRDYSGMKENLIIIVNAMADAGYPIEPIWYAQRLYFECYDMIDKLETEELLKRLMNVFAKSGNTVETVSFLAKEHLEIERTDKCAFVFNDIIPPANITPFMSEVTYNISYDWKENYESYSIYDRWLFEHGESEYEDNQIRYLQIIVCKMAENGASEYDIRLAQLIYSSYLANVRYRSDWLEILLDAFEHGTPDYVLLCENMNEIFGVDMNSNQEIADYYDGISSFIGGEE